MDAAAEAPLYDVEALRRSEFPALAENRLVYLNAASTGPLPTRARRALADFIDHCCRPDPALYSEHINIPLRTRERCAALIGARPEEIAVGFNTSFGINLAATALPLQPGDRILLLDGEFPANIYPWLNLERRGIRIEFIPRNSRGLPNEEAALERLQRGDVRVFAVSAVSFSSGYQVDLKAISRECQRHGTYLVVDGIQALGVVPFDVTATPVDILACGGQKWLLSPQGAGFAYIRRDLIQRLDPQTVGWLAYKPSQDFGDLLNYALDPLDDARRFELGSLAFASLEAFNHSLDLLAELRVPCIESHVRAVQQELIDWVSGRHDVQWLSDLRPERRSGILAFTAKHPELLDQQLRAANITASLREGAIRVSVHAFNCKEDIKQLIRVLEAALSGKTLELED